VLFGGIPRQQPHTIPKNWANNAGLELTVQHSALHNHHVRVKVVSYIPSTKGKHASTADPNDDTKLLEAVWALAGEPSQAAVPSATTTTASSTPSGRQSGLTSVGGDNPNDEEYVYHLPGKTKDQCDTIAEQIRDRISAHEFTINMVWTPNKAEFDQLCQISPEFIIKLSGLQQQSNEGFYYPRTLKWDYEVGDTGMSQGLLLSFDGVNHPVPKHSAVGGGENVVF
jgi:hypothetical protein